MVWNFSTLSSFFGQFVWRPTLSFSFYLSAPDAHMLQPNLTAWAVSVPPLKSDPSQTEPRGCAWLCISWLYCTWWTRGLETWYVLWQIWIVWHPLNARKMAKRKKKQDALIDVEKTQLESGLNFILISLWGLVIGSWGQAHCSRAGAGKPQSWANLPLRLFWELQFSRNTAPPAHWHIT